MDPYGIFKIRVPKGFSFLVPHQRSASDSFLRNVDEC